MTTLLRGKWLLLALAMLAFSGGSLFHAMFLSPADTVAVEDCDHDICKVITYSDGTTEEVCSDDGTFTWEDCDAQNGEPCDMDSC